ncbi:Cytochrome P450 4c21 (CYPIVC21) [Durusdinium trenchii]|uniref:Cytochrome P450 4c21 (CYPIVC21) n=2 Tax=Durusdinium trenchii TaxID=1381693 RepID=A0ABP0S2C5_9DINO
MASAVAGLRTLDSVTGVGKFFVITARNHLAKARLNLEMNAENPRMFKLYFGPKPALAVTHPELARQVLTRPKDFQKADNDAVASKSISSILNYTKEGRNASLVTSNGAEWQAMRKPVDPTFEKTALRNLIPKFNQTADTLMDSWRGTEEVDAKRDMSRFALDILGTAMLGQSFGAIEGSFDDTYRQYQTVMAELMNPIYLLFPVLERLPLPRNLRYKAAVNHMYGVLEGAVYARIEQRREQMASGKLNEEPQDMLDMLLGPGLDAKGVLPEGHMVPMLWIFFLAGHDTTAVSLAWVMHYLAKHPDVQERARKEAIAVLDGKKDPDADDVERIPYINAVISESLRLRPPVYNLITREASVDTELDGVSVPKGTGVSLHIAAINQHPEVWDNPSEFNPERFMQEKQPRVFNYLPFSAGPRRCLGDKFSLLEQRTLLLKLLLLQVLPHKDMAKQEDNFCTSPMSLMLLQPKEMKVRVRPLQ